MFRRSIPAITLVIAIGLFVTLSCSDGRDPTVPGDITSGHAQNGACLGIFQIFPTDDLSSAGVYQVRIPQFDVTQWADIKIIGADWDPVLRNWTLTVQVSNPTQFTGWGVQAIFTELGGKELRWPDGFRWLDIDGNPGDERYPFFAIEKLTPQREFIGLHVATQDLTFHFPEGIDKWLPITFFLDAHLLEPRPDPMVEDLEIAQFPPPCQHATVTAHIRDHQSEVGELEVWVDLSPIGLSSIEPMFDDGEHDDGLPDDGIFGAYFTGGTVGHVYTLTVYAMDPEGNSGENDVIYSPISYPPLPPIDFETLLIDTFCLFVDEHLVVIEDQESWDEFWGEFSPWDMPPPVIDFDKYRIIAVCIGQRPNSCYSVEITNIDWSDENCGWCVQYTETVPGENCECEEYITSPFHLVTVNQAAFDIMFDGDIFVDECSDPQDPCLDLISIAGGTHGHESQQTMKVIMTQSEWTSWWNATIGNGSPPEIDFETDMVIAVTMGVKNTSGFYPTVDSACLDDEDNLEIVVGWHIPGPDCMVLMVITHPYVAYSAQKSVAPYYWTTYDDIYDCD